MSGSIVRSKEATSAGLGPRGGKGYAFTARVTAETRSALEAEALRSGRSIGDVAERWIDEARRGRASVEDLLGGLQVADAVRTMIAFAKAASEHIGDPLQDPAAREALIHGWAHLSGMAVPFVTFNSEEAALASVRFRLKKECRRLFDAEGQANLNKVLATAAEATDHLDKTDSELQTLMYCFNGLGLADSAAIKALSDVVDTLSASDDAEVRRSSGLVAVALAAFTPVWEAHEARLQEGRLMGRDLAEVMSAPARDFYAEKQRLDWSRFGSEVDQPAREQGLRRFIGLLEEGAQLRSAQLKG